MSQLKVNSIVPSGGLASGAFGGIVQVVTAFKGNVFTTQVNGMNWVDVTGMSLNITPQSASSRILVQVTIGGMCCRSTNQRYAVGLKRGSTLIGQATDTESRTAASVGSMNFEGGSNGIENGAAFHFIDHPKTTSATTYKVCVNAEGNGHTVCINRSDSDSNSNSVFRTSSTITAYELGG